MNSLQADSAHIPEPGEKPSDPFEYLTAFPQVSVYQL